MEFLGFLGVLDGRGVTTVPFELPFERPDLAPLANQRVLDLAVAGVMWAIAAKLILL